MIRRKPDHRSFANAQRNRSADARRKGGAVVEMIMVLPVLLVIFMGSVEACNLLFLQQATTEAAYDGALRGIRPGATEADVQSAVTQLLAARDITTTSVEVGDLATSQSIEDVTSGELFSVKVTINTEGHLISPVVFATFSKIETIVTARKQ